MLDVALEKVLAAQTQQVLGEAECALDKPITLEELHLAAEKLARNKVPSNDGIPMEFHLALWDEIDPLLCTSGEMDLLKVLWTPTSQKAGSLSPRRESTFAR